MDVLRQDLRQSVKSLRHHIGHAAVVVLTLAVGIGANTAVFTILHATILRPLPYAEPDRLAMIWTHIPARGIGEATSAWANVEDWREAGGIEDLAAFDPITLTLTGGEWAEQVSAVLATANVFSVLGVQPAIGRSFTRDEERRQAPVVVVSHDFAQQRFGASRAGIGATLELGGRPFLVVGVMPPGFGFPERSTRLWLPQTLFGEWEETAVQRGTGPWRVLARLRPGVSLEQAQAQLGTIAVRLERTYPGANEGLGVRIVPLHEQVTGVAYRLAAWMLFGAVALVLLIAWANAAHLIVGRALDRRREFALRQALGATTPRLLRQAVTENGILALLAGFVGVLLAAGGLRILLAMAPADLPRLDEIAIDGTVLLQAAVVSIGAGILFGIAPLLRSRDADLFGALRQGPGAAGGASASRVRSLLIALQFALAIILVFGANLLVRSLVEATRVETGFEAENVLMANLSVEDASRRIPFYERAVQDVQAIAGVRAAGLIEDLFIGGAPNRAITIEGRAPAPSSFERVRFDAIAGDLFRTIDVPIRQGRSFSGSDGADATPVAIINETMARRFWPGESPIGRRFRPGGPEAQAPWIEVVGVVGDMRRQGFDSEPIAQVFRPFVQEPSRNMNLLVRSDRPASALLPSIRARLAEIDRNVPVYQVTEVGQALDRYLLQRRFQTFLLGLFSAIAVMLAAVGIYGLAQYSVTRRMHELGVRMALGASAGRVVLMVLRQALRPAVPGLALGTLGAVWLADGISALLFGVSATDPLNLLIPAGILLATALLASCIPAGRAARVDPTAVLRGR